MPQTLPQGGIEPVYQQTHDEVQEDRNQCLHRRNLQPGEAETCEATHSTQLPGSERKAQGDECAQLSSLGRIVPPSNSDNARAHSTTSLQTLASTENDNNLLLTRRALLPGRDSTI